MSNIDALLDGETNNKVTLTVIEPNRSMSYNGQILLGVEGDHKAERIYFKAPRYIFMDEDVDLCSENIKIFIKFKNASNNTYIYPCDDKTTYDITGAVVVADDGEGNVSIDIAGGANASDDGDGDISLAAEEGTTEEETTEVVEDEYVYFSWVLTKTVAESAGKVSFIVCVQNIGTDENGAEVIKNEWHSTPFTGEVQKGIPVDSATPEIITDPQTSIYQLKLEIQSVDLIVKQHDDTINALSEAVNNKADKTELDAKANQTDLDALAETVNSKANQTDLDALENTVNAKADQSDVDALETTVNSKASQSDLNALKTRVSSLENSSGSDDLSSRVTAAEGNITTLQGDVNTLETVVNSKASQTSVDALKARVETLESGGGSGETDTNISETEFNSLKTRVTTLETNVENLQGDVTELSTTKASQSDVNALTNRVTNLEKSSGSSSSSTKFTLLVRENLSTIKDGILHDYISIEDYISSNYNELMIVMRVGEATGSITIGLGSVNASESTSDLIFKATTDNTAYLCITLNKTSDGYFAWRSGADFVWSASASDYIYLKNCRNTGIDANVSVAIYGR